MKKQIMAAALGLALLCGCGGGGAPVETADPYAGMVQVESGYGTLMWVQEYEEVPVNRLTARDFEDGAYTGTRFTVRRGIDVSEHQAAIDWSAAAGGGVEFAVLRAGYRGWGEAGTLNRDAFFQENVEGAAAAGVDMGVYFFSQATSVAEAVEEADYLLDILSPYPPETFALPVYFDWEPITFTDARTDDMDGTAITACAAAFCGRLAGAGYAAGVYTNRSLGYFYYDLRELTDYDLWIAANGSYPDFYYAHSIWQYSSAGAVPGVTGDVDLDYQFLPAQAAE